jgi:hypothetical protein
LNEVSDAQARFGIFEMPSSMGRRICEKKTEEVVMLDGHLGKDSTKGVRPGIIVRYQDPGSVIQEVVKVEKVHRVLLQLGGKWF